MADPLVAVMTMTTRQAEGGLFPKLKASLRSLIDRDENKPECFLSSNFYLRFMEHVGITTTATSQEENSQPQMVVMRFYLESFSQESFYRTLCLFLQSLAGKMHRGEKFFYFNHFDRDNQILSLALNVVLLLDAADIPL